MTQLCRVILAVLSLSLFAASTADAATERARITWNKANDIDLHIYDDAGNHAYYGAQEAIPHAVLSPDITDSGGPETFVDNREPSTRHFRFEVCYYAETEEGSGPTQVSVTIAGLPHRVITLSAPDECVDAGETGGEDADGDGVQDSADNCPSVPNGGQADLDGDGAGDACDPDDDGDGAADDADNCPRAPNGDQLDTDGDGQGDACDPDDDNDGLPDAGDNCPLLVNPDQRDVDANGKGDDCQIADVTVDTTAEEAGAGAAAVQADGEADEEEIVDTVTVVRNDGPEQAAGLVVDDVVEGQATALSVRTTKGTCTQEAQAPVCEIPTLGVGEEARIVVRVRAGEQPEAPETTEETAEDYQPEADEAEIDDATASASSLRARVSATAPKPAAYSRKSNSRTSTKDPNDANNKSGAGQRIKDCEGSIEVRNITIRAGCLKKRGPGKWSAKTRVVVEGLTISGAEIGINTKTRSLFVVGNATIRAGYITLYRGNLRLQLGERFKLDTPGGSNLKKFPLKGKFTADFVPAKKAIDITLGVSMEKALKGRIEEASGDVKLRVSDGRGLQLESIVLKADKVKVAGKLTVKKFELAYTHSKDEWVGKGKVVLPVQSEIEVKGEVVIKSNRLKKLVVDVDNLNKSIAYGVFLQSLGFGVQFRPAPLGLEGRMRLSFGPRVRGKEIASVTGSMLWHGKRITIKGTTKLITKEVGSGTLTYDYPNALRLKSKVDYTIGGYGTSGTMAGAIDGARSMLLEGTVRITLPGPDSRGSALVSHKGIGACGERTLLGRKFSVGFRYSWGDRLPRVGCDLGPLRGRSSLQSGARSVQMPGGLPRALIQVSGAGAAPHVRVTDPAGTVLEVNAATPEEGAVAGSMLGFRADAESRTYVLIEPPRAGAYKVEALDGSAPIASVESALGLAEPKVEASVKRKGKRLVLRYAVRKIPGQRVTFFEDGAGVHRQIGRPTTKASGSVRFKPAPGGRSRRILAAVEQDGLPRAELKRARALVEQLAA